MVFEKLKHILHELKSHAPFTIFGAAVGILFMLAFQHAGNPRAKFLFSIFHPGHVLLSAMVTAAVFRLNAKRKNFFLVLLVGYFGSIGVATLSDSIIPFCGESILGVRLPVHGQVHHENENEEEVHSDTAETDHEHHKHTGDLHLGFIEEWYIVNPAAIIGVLLAYFLPHTKFPHAGHVLISTWASSSHVLMNLDGKLTALTAIGMFIVLFIAVWLPCCISDIVFPLLFVRENGQYTTCDHCGVHLHIPQSKKKDTQDEH